MLIPSPTRPLLIRHGAEGNWELDARGYPLPSEALLRELDYLYTLEQSRKGAKR
jgi:hypothetical protein